MKTFPQVLFLPLLAVAFVTPVLCQTTYYWDGSSDPTAISSWGINSDGSGANPSDFNGSGQIFRIDSGTADISSWAGSSPLVVGASGSASAAGSYTDAANLSFEVGSQFSYTGSSASFRDSLVYGDLSLGMSTSDGTPGIVQTLGDLEISSNEVNLSSSTSYAWSIGGDVVIANGATFDLANGSASSTVEIFGTLTNNGTIQRESSGSPSIRFAGAGPGTVQWGSNNSEPFSVSIDTGRSMTFADALNNSGGSVAVSGVLLGDSLVAGETEVLAGGVHAPGLGGVGLQTFGSDLHYQTDSIFEWDLNANSTASGFDTVSVGGAIEVSPTGTLFRVNLGTGTNFAVGNNFWDDEQNWDLSSIFLGGVDTGSFASVSSVQDVSSFGSFSINSTTLTWTPIPEPQSTLVGLLIGAGLVRRRR